MRMTGFGLEWKRPVLLRLYKCKGQNNTKKFLYYLYDLVLRHAEETYVHLLLPAFVWPWGSDHILKFGTAAPVHLILVIIIVPRLFFFLFNSGNRY